MDQSNHESKRIAALVGGVVASAAVVVVLILVVVNIFSGGKPSRVPHRLTAGDRASIVSTTQNFVNLSSNFGFTNVHNITKNNVFHLTEYVARNPNSFDSRENIYSVLLARYIAPSSPIDFTDITNWGASNDLLENRQSVKSAGILYSLPKGYSGEGREYATIEAHFTSINMNYSPTRDDSSWNGTFNLNQSSVKVTENITLIKTQLGWRVYGIQISNPGATSIILNANQIGGSWPSPKVVGMIQAPIPGSFSSVNFHNQHLAQTKIVALAKSLIKCSAYKSYSLPTLEALITGRQAEGVILSCTTPSPQPPASPATPSVGGGSPLRTLSSHRSSKGK